MFCPKCGAKCSENAASCYNCGYNLNEDDIMKNIDNAVKTEKKMKSFKLSKKKDANKPAEETPAKKNNFKLIAILSLIAIAIVAVAILILIAVFSFNKGASIYDDIQIGRDIAYIENETKIEFSPTSKYDAVKDVNNFNYILEDESSISVEGINLPAWAVMLKTGSDKTASSAHFYDFSVLKKTWKGFETSAKFEPNTITYGMTEREVEKALGFDPYCKSKFVDNTIITTYRYYFTDTQTGNDSVYEITVEYSDINGKVKNCEEKEIPYQNFFLNTK